jgi:microcystin-dependent protein
MSTSGTILYDSISETLYLNGKTIVPSGSLIQYAGSIAPNGWMLCQGQLLNISSYTSLFSVLSNTYGGDGVTTFALPDLRGRVTVGSNSLYPLSSTGGSASHTLTISQMPSHNHTGTIDSVAGHTHTGAIESVADHTHIGTISSVGNHIHNYQDAYFAENRGLTGNNMYGTGSGTDIDNNFIYRVLNGTLNGTYSNSPSDIPTSESGSHNHAMSNSNAGGHTHTMSNSNAGSHTHTMTNTSTGGSASFSILQPYISLNYIIKY